MSDDIKKTKSVNKTKSDNITDNIQKDSNNKKNYFIVLYKSNFINERFFK